MEQELQKLREENAALKQENSTLKSNHQELLRKFDNVYDRLTKLEEDGPSTQPVNNTKSDEISNLKSETLSVADSIRNLQNGWSRADERINIHDSRLDDQDQYLRMNSLIMLKLDDIPKKTYGLDFSEYALRKLKQLLPSIANKIKIEDIDVSHPLPPTKDKKNSYYH